MKIKDLIGIPLELREALSGAPEAMSGDIALRVTPATLASSAAAVNAAIAGAAGKFTREVKIELVTADGDVHKWFNGSLSVAGSETTAGDGTADPSAATVALVDGVGTCVFEYIGAWSGGTKQKETATAVATITGAGNASVTVTAAGMTGSPKTISVPVALNDGASEVGAKIRAALAADSAVAAMFTVSGAAGAIVLERKLAVANDATLNIALADGTCVGLTTAASSANTTAGVAADTATVTVTGGTILGYTVSHKTSVDTLIA
jgi:hypothetical protein